MKIIIYLVMSLLIMSSLVSALTMDDEDLLIYQQMDEASGDIYDDKTNARTKYIMSGAETLIYQQTPAVNWSTYSIDFDGDSAYFENTSIEVQNLFNTDMADGFTVGVSFNADDIANHGTLVSWVRDVSGFKGFAMRVYQNNIECTFIEDVIILTDDAYVDRNHTVICVYNTTDLIMYNKLDSDGTPTRSGSLDDTYEAVLGNLTIGTRWVYDQFFNGNIDEVWILNRSMTQAEVFDVLSNGMEITEDITSPTLSDAVCTSCASGTNNTVDSTPTVNVTCTDIHDCIMVRIANDSTLNFGTAGANRNCTAGSEDTWVCTLPSSDKLSVIDYAQPVYFWANDTDGNAHTAFNLTMDITFQTPFFKLDGLAKNRTYEYETTANISTNSPYIDILDDTGRYIDYESVFNYPIDKLRINKFNRTNESVNISSGDRINVTIDNRTDLYNASVSLTGFSNPKNLTINVSGEIINFPGTLLENNLYQNQFIYAGISQTKLNLSYTTAGIKVIYINFSNQGDYLTRTGNLSFTMTAYDLDIGNDFDFQDNFSNSDYINASSVINVSAPVSTFDDLEDLFTNSTDYYSEEYTCIGTCPSYPPESLLAYTERTTGEADDYLLISVRADCDSNLCYNDRRVELTVLNTLDLDNISFFNFTISKYLIEAGTFKDATSSAFMKMFATDGTNDVLLWSGNKTNFNFLYLIGNTSDGSTWTVYENETFKSSADVSGLGTNKRIKFDLFADAYTGTSGPQYAVSTMRIFNIDTSGIRLKRNNGSYEVNVSTCFESNTLKVGTTNIARVFISVDEEIPDDTSVKHFTSNNNGSSYESFVPDTFHTFSTSDNDFKIKFCLNSTNSSLSSFVANYRAQIIPTPPPSLVIDVGLDGSDMQIGYELNSTTTPINYNGTDTSFNLYINRTGSGLIPVSFTIGGGGTIEIKNTNATQNINPVRLNTTAIQTLSSINFYLNYTDGTVQLNDVKFDYRGRKNITIVAHNGDYSNSLNRTIFVMYSPFNVTILPQSIDWWDPSPNIYETSTWIQNNIPPFGNADGDGNPFWNVTRRIWDRPIDIYVKWNESVNTCQTTWFNGINQSDNTTLPVTINTSPQLIVDHLEGIQANISTFTNISCSLYNSTLIFTYLCWFSLDSDAVLTQDWDSNCEYIN